MNISASMDTSASFNQDELEKMKALMSSKNISHSDKIKALSSAIKDKRKETIKLVLSYISDVNEEITILDTPIHLAVESCDAEIVMLLLDKGFNINAKNKDGRTPLHIAIVYGHVEIIKLLLNRCANVNAKDKDDVTPLCIAAQKGHLQIVEELLKHRACINLAYKCNFKEYFIMKKLSGVTALHAAVEKGHLQVVAHLLKKGASVNSAYTSTFKNGYTPLHVAVETENEDIIKLLLKYRANINAGDKVKTPLHIAAEKGYESIVKLLLESGANVDAQDINGKTVLYIAAQNGNSLAVDAILRHCPDVDNKINKSSLPFAISNFGEKYKKIVESLLQYGFTIKCSYIDLHLVRDSVEKGYLKVIENIFKTNSDIFNKYDLANNKKHTLLHIAAKNCQEQIAKLLIKSGSDVNATDEISMPPIFYATANIDLKMIKLLISSGSNLKHNPDLLHMAVRKKSKEIVEFFLQHGVDINTTDNLKRTALHITALDFMNDNDSKINAEIAKLLLIKGVDVNAETEDGLTALHLAAKNGLADVTQELLEHNIRVNIYKENNILPLQFSVEKENKTFFNKGTNVNAQSKDGETALHFATTKGHTEVVRMLLQYGVKLDVKCIGGKTPLHIAATLGYQGILKLLLDSGATIDIRDNLGKTPLHHACCEQHEVIISTLLEYFSDININDYDGRIPLCYVETKVNPNKFTVYVILRDDGLCFDVDNNSMSIEKGIQHMFKKHIAKLINIDFYVSEKNLQYFNENEMMQFEFECHKEVENMKNHKIIDNVLLYDILKHFNALDMYANNEDIVKALSTDYKTEFPIYSSLISNLWKRVTLKRDQMNRSIKMFQYVFSSFPELPYNCAEYIISHLSNDDIRVLAAFSVTNCNMK